MLEVVAPDRAGRKHAKRRVAQASEQVEAAAVKQAIDVVAAATTAAVAANTAVYG